MNAPLVRPRIVFAFGPDVSLAASEDAAGVAGLRLSNGNAHSVVPQAPVDLAAVARTLVAGGGTEEALEALVPTPAGVLALTLHLGLWWRIGWLRSSVVLGEVTLLTVVPTGPVARRPRPLEPDRRWRLSRFAYLHRGGREMWLESPNVAARVLLPDPGCVAVISALALPRSLEELAQATGADTTTCRAILEILAGIGMAAAVDGDGALPEDRDARLRHWELHDLLLHKRSRRGYHDGRLGATFRFKGQLPPAPAFEPPSGGESIALAEADIAALSQSDLPFTAVLEQRRSTRRFGATPLTLEQLGIFLHRTARLTERPGKAAAPARSHDVSARPYPSAGAVYDLELYLTITACQGLAPGLYHYQPDSHRLERVAGLVPAALAQLAGAQASGSLDAPPQILVTLASRFQRVAWRYEGIAYALCLKNVGVLLQTMYLVATAMRIGACAMGSGDSEAFARATASDGISLIPVGEIVLGSLEE